MKNLKTTKIHSLAIYITLMLITFSHTTLIYALTEAEVETIVTEQGKTAVTGNLFIWFICALAFLKISQKMDSFMSSLGINVGNTGGSMLSELMLTSRGLMAISSSGSNKGSFVNNFNKKSSSDASFLQGGLAGAVGRKYDNTAKVSASDNGNNSLGGSIFNNSMKKNGSFASNGISAVAKGNIQRDGMITGEKANSAFNSYFSNQLGSNSNNNTNNNLSSSNNQNTSSSVNPLNSSSSNITNSNENEIRNSAVSDVNTIQSNSSSSNPYHNNLENSNINLNENGEHNVNKGDVTPLNSQNITFGTPVNNQFLSNENKIDGFTKQSSNETTNNMPTPIQTSNTIFPQNNNTILSENTTSQVVDSSSIPTYSNIEIGGGRITGTETSVTNPQGINFAMYNSEQYVKPDTDYSIVTSNDNTSWYKQYETKSVVKTPYEKPNGNIEHTVKLIDKLPSPPNRKDRL